MIRIVTKRHAETRRFKDAGFRFREGEMDQAIKQAEYMSQTEYLVQVQYEPAFFTGWHEAKSIRNPHNALVH